jgi:GT2 family glycosyltransferase
MNDLVSILTPTYNTEKFIKSTIESAKNQTYTNWEMILVDDASTDGTSDAIREQFPDVNIIQGNGNLYWNRGMHLAWETASATKDYDYYMWLNDDTFLFKNAIEILMFEIFPNSIVCGITKSSISDNISYGGYLNNSNLLLVPNGFYQNVDYCNGNCVLIPRNIFNKLGNLDLFFHHALGDFDYTRRAIKNNFDVLISCNYIGICDTNNPTPKWLNNSYNILKRFKFLYHPLSGCKPSEFFILNYRQNGLYIAIIGFLTLHFKAIFPSFYFLFSDRKKL